MKNLFIKALALAGILAAACSASYAEGIKAPNFRENIPTDSILLSDPCVLADEATSTYYMTGTGGKLWKSADLSTWSGPYTVAFPDSTSWMGSHPHIWAAEIHHIDDKYYYFATFTNPDIIIKTNKNGAIPRRASHILVSDNPDGPFVPVSDADYLPADRPTLDGTYWQEPDGQKYMVFCGEWLDNDNGTMELLPLADDLSHPAGEPRLMFTASDSPWSREERDGEITFNRVTDGPWLFRTATGRLGMIWTSWIMGKYTMGVAYSQSGTIDGPWVQEPEPITGPDYGHGMIFTDFEGNTVLSAHTHKEVDGRYIRRPLFLKADLTGDKLVVGPVLESAGR